MKLTLILDPDRDEEVVIYAHQRTETVDKIEQLLSSKTAQLMGFCGDEVVVLDYVKVCYFTVENDHVYACVGDRRYRVRHRLYQLEQMAPPEYVKIHQSCLANTRQIARFEVAFSGALRVVFKNGDTDYVSRRQLKSVKERFGL